MSYREHRYEKDCLIGPVMGAIENNDMKRIASQFLGIAKNENKQNLENETLPRRGNLRLQPILNSKQNLQNQDFLLFADQRGKNEKDCLIEPPVH